jgi:hypothetical protein
MNFLIGDEFIRLNVVGQRISRSVASRKLQMAVANTSTTQHSEDESQSQDEGRMRRAQAEEMNLALLRQGGLYAVDSASGSTYEVDLLEETCTCPDHRKAETPGPCKHIRRVQLELNAGQIPRPDGRLPQSSKTERPLPDSSGHRLVSTLRTRIREREERIASLQAEIQVLQFVCDIAEEVGSGGNFDLKQLSADEHGPASQL